jgi:hypothetical protein
MEGPIDEIVERHIDELVNELTEHGFDVCNVALLIGVRETPDKEQVRTSRLWPANEVDEGIEMLLEGAIANKIQQLEKDGPFGGFSLN